MVDSRAAPYTCLATERGCVCRQAGRTMRRGIFAAVLGLLLAAGASPALAQTTTTYQPGGCSGSTNLGTTAVGGTITGTIAPACLFGGATLTMSVNGAAAGTKTANNSSGGVTVNLQVVSS